MTIKIKENLNMRKFRTDILAGLAFLIGLVTIVTAAYALDVTRVAPVAPETGHRSEPAAQILSAARLQLGSGSGTTSSFAITINKAAGVITTESLTTAAGATQAVTLTDSKIRVGDMIQCTVDPNGSAGTPICANVTVSAGQAVFLIQNIHSATALNAAVKIYFMIVTAGNPN